MFTMAFLKKLQFYLKVFHKKAFLIGVFLLTFFTFSLLAQCEVPDPPFILPSMSELSKLRLAVLTTDKGEIEFNLFPEEAPWHIANLKYLADKGFYRNKAFHIFIKNYIIQSGSLVSKPEIEKYYYSLPCEFSHHQHIKGTLGMARLPDEKNPSRNSTSTQFHILLTSASKMDGNFTIFGQMTAGEDVLNRLVKGDRIRDFKVYVSD